MTPSAKSTTSAETFVSRLKSTALGAGIVNIMDFLVPTALPTFSDTNWDLEKGEKPFLEEIVIRR
jgi:hypothetical protein